MFDWLMHVALVCIGRKKGFKKTKLIKVEEDLNKYLIWKAVEIEKTENIRSRNLFDSKTVLKNFQNGIVDLSNKKTSKELYKMIQLQWQEESNTFKASKCNNIFKK